MKTIDLGERYGNLGVSEPSKSKVYYPTINFSDNGHNGQPSFDDTDLGKTFTVTAHVKLTDINTYNNADQKAKGKKFSYALEVHKLELDDGIMDERERLKARRDERESKK